MADPRCLFEILNESTGYRLNDLERLPGRNWNKRGFILTKIKIGILATLIICLYLGIGLGIFLLTFRFVMMPAIAHLNSLGFQGRNKELLGLGIAILVLVPELIFAGWVMRKVSKGILRMFGKEE